MNISEALKARRSIRAFLNEPVARADLESIIQLALRAPSGKNTQPWHLACVTGDTLAKISQALLSAFERGECPHPDYQYYPKPLPPTFEKRAVECGRVLYEALGVDRHDEIARGEQWAKNYRFFGAPACIFVFVDLFATEGSFLDVGLMMENLMLAALEYELGTCPQASLAGYPEIVKSILGAPFEEKKLIAGISMGYPDLTHPVNQYRTEREALDEVMRWYG